MIRDKTKKGFALRATLCFVAGSIGELGMAPTNFWPALIVALSILYVVLVWSSSVKSAFIYGWIFAFAYFMFSLSWVGNALLVEGNPYAWARPLAITGLPFILAFFTATGAALAKRFGDLYTLPGFLVFSASLALVEYLRSFVFTGFPWNLFGYTWAGILPIVQTVAVGNIYFLTWLTIIWLALPGYLYLGREIYQAKIKATVVVLFSFLLCFSFGAWRLAVTPFETVPGVSIRLVQPNISQAEKWNREKAQEHFAKLIELSRPENGDDDKTIVIWPETALSYWMSKDPIAMQQLTEVLRSYKGGGYLLTGVLRADPVRKIYYNSLVMLDESGEMTNVYDKHHLVPYGEYIPYQKWIPLKPVVNFSGFAHGDGPHTFEIPGALKYSPVICYEVIFSGALTDGGNPDLIVNVTNDAWYGFSAGPYQHFTQAIFRAVEEGIPVARSANTGFSGVIDPLGRISEKSKLFTEYEKKLALPARNMLLTNYISYKNILICYKNIIFVGLVLLIILYGHSLKRKI